MDDEVADAYVPAGHAAQAVLPKVGEMYPTAHGLQAPPRPTTEEYNPAAQPTQLNETDAPVVTKFVPAAQLVHVTVPVAAAY
jgi:hypothetical protein